MYHSHFGGWESKLNAEVALLYNEEHSVEACDHGSFKMKVKPVSSASDVL